MALLEEEYAYVLDVCDLRWAGMANFPPSVPLLNSYTFIIGPYKVPIQSNYQHLKGKMFVFPICGTLEELVACT